MTAKQMRLWLDTVPDDSVIEYNHYSWTAVEAKNIRAHYASSPKLEMTDVCNAEQESL